METRHHPGHSFAPTPPLNPSTLDIPWALALDLVARRLMLDGHSTMGNLTQSLKLAPPIVEAVFRHFQKEQQAEIRGTFGQDYLIGLTNAGRQFANDRIKVCQYAGPAPVPLKSYHTAVRSQAAKVKVTRQQIYKAMGDLVLEDDTVDKLGPALISQKSLFLFGPTGNGKTSLAERLARVYDDAILIPYAVEVDGQIIIVFDPVVHERIDVDYPGLDPRWVVCRRPEVMTAGELTNQMLELSLDHLTNIYAAPVQMKANNGVLVIDDFGRQAMTPTELLNRWILPLDRKVDYLTLSYGLKFQTPFQLMIVFSTNLIPTRILDKAFLRRVPNKIYVHPVHENVFLEIFQREAGRCGFDGTTELGSYLMRLCQQWGGKHLRACYPRDICDIISCINTYESRPAQMNKEDLRRAVELYFAEHAEAVETEKDD